MVMPKKINVIHGLNGANITNFSLLPIKKVQFICKPRKITYLCREKLCITDKFGCPITQTCLLVSFETRRQLMICFGVAFGTNPKVQTCSKGYFQTNPKMRNCSGVHFETIPKVQTCSKVYFQTNSKVQTCFK